MNLEEQKREILMKARALCEKAQAEERGFTEEENGQIDAWLKEADELQEKIEKAAGDAKLVQRVLDLTTGEVITEPVPVQPQPKAAGTLGAMFTESAEFKAWLKANAPRGTLPEKSRVGNSPPVSVPDLFKRLMAKTLVTGLSDTSAGAFVETDYTRLYAEIGRHPLRLRDLITVSTTTSDLVHFVRQTAQVTQATPTAEANVTEYSGATGEISGEKPEGAMAFEPITIPVRSIPVWIPVTKRALADVAQLRTLIDNELRADVNEELESQMLTGNGVGENMTGALNTAGILTQAFTTDMLTTIRMARTTLAVTGREYMPTGIIMHPNDAETLDLTQDANNQYYFGGPIDGNVQRVWRVPLIESVFMTEGSCMMGNWRRAYLWDREDATITASDSHADFFIRNMIAILCELRAAFALVRPSSFITIDLEAGS